MPVSDCFAKFFVDRGILQVKDEHVVPVKEKKRLLSTTSCMKLFRKGSLERIITDFFTIDVIV